MTSEIDPMRIVDDEIEDGVGVGGLTYRRKPAYARVR
jgi:hypothetical protein